MPSNIILLQPPRSTLKLLHPYITSATHEGGAGGDFLTQYATHRAPASKTIDAVEYRMTQLNGWHMTRKINSFCEGAAALRIAPDWAEEQRGQLVAGADLKIQGSDPAGLQLPALVIQPLIDTEEASESSLDELAREPSARTSITSGALPQ